MAYSTLSHTLADCLDNLMEGETIEACLDRHHGDREALRPLLEVARALLEHPLTVVPSLGFILRLWALLVGRPLAADPAFTGLDN